MAEVILDRVDSKITLKVNDLDIPQIRKMKEMMMTEGWLIFLTYMADVRKALIRDGENCVLDSEKRKLADVKWATIRGFDEVTRVPETLIKLAQEFIDSEEEEKNAQE